MDPFYIKAIQLLLSLSLLIVLHELGHFIPAKLFKTRVEKFYLFFDLKFSLFKKKIGETVYGIGWLPLGGYVKISGMIDESMDKEQMAKPPQPWEFRSKPAWQRLIIMLGGVTVNIILGFVIYMMILLVFGRDYVKPESLSNGFTVAEPLKAYGFEDGDNFLSVDGEALENPMNINEVFMLRDFEKVEVQHTNGSIEVLEVPEDIGVELFKAGYQIPFTPVFEAKLDSIVPESPAGLAGLQPGDQVIGVNGEPVQFWHELTSVVKNSVGQELLIKYQRDNAIDSVKVSVPKEAVIGIYVDANLERGHRDYSFTESLVGGFSFGMRQLTNYAAQFKYIFTEKGASQVGGFGAIGGLFPDTWDWVSFWETTAFISIILAFMNILPIPALDGGHVMFLLYEMVSGRKPNEKVMEYAQMIGFFIIIALVLYANGNDVYRYFFE